MQDSRVFHRLQVSDGDCLLVRWSSFIVANAKSRLELLLLTSDGIYLEVQRQRASANIT